MIPLRELDAIRAVQEEAMPDLVDIQRRTNSDDGFGGRQNTTWATVATGVPARVSKAQTLDLGGQGGRKVELEKWLVRVPHATDIREGDRVIFGTLVIDVDEFKYGSNKTAATVAGEKAK